jgi:hypothetical protein
MRKMTSVNAQINTNNQSSRAKLQDWDLAFELILISCLPPFVHCGIRLEKTRDYL